MRGEKKKMKRMFQGNLQAVHNRTISISTYAAGDDAVIVEGVLTDNRLVDTWSVPSGEKMEPGVIHNLAVRLFIECPSLRITDVEVDMDRVPLDECMHTRDSLKPLIGQSISPGFTRWVKQHLGGAQGCTHLNALLIAMAPAVFQGFWNARTSRRIDARRATEGMSPEYLIDTCWVWRSEGPLASELRAAVAGEGREDGPFGKD